MEQAEFQKTLYEIFQKNALDRFCTAEIAEKFGQFTQIFTEENAKTNLSAIREVPDIIGKHFADCLLAEPLIKDGASLLDLGCGGGFPTFPLAITRKDLKITALDSTGKKISFVKSTAERLNLQNITAICGRIEENGFVKRKESFDVVISRAVAALPVLCELALPFVKVGGVLIAMKGASGAEELQNSMKAIGILGGKAEKDEKIALKTAGDEEIRHLIVIKKVSVSPSQYPRSYAQISKKPL